MCALVACGGGSSGKAIDAPGGGDAPVVGACALFPSSFIFNTPIDSLPVDSSSSTYLSSIGGSTHLHLDLGTQTDSTQSDYYGIPYNTVHGGSYAWPGVAYDPSGAMDESDCANAGRSELSPCPGSPGNLPVPGSPLVEGGINSTPGDHHMLLVDVDACRLWELDAAYLNSGTWTIYSSASWDLTSNALRPDTWTSADAAGFPIMPLLLRADEASSGTIHHALRFTVNTSRKSYVWPARHEAGSTTSTSVPQMGQLFRLQASFTIPDTFNVQSKAILQAMKTYGMYIADNGSDWYVQGEPSASWMDTTFSEVQSVTGDQFEAVDITAITSRSGFDVNSGAVP